MHLNTLTLLDWQEGPDSDNVRTFVECKQPESVDQAAEYANLHFQLLQIGKETRGNVAVTQRPRAYYQYVITAHRTMPIRTSKDQRLMHRGRPGVRIKTAEAPERH